MQRPNLNNHVHKCASFQFSWSLIATIFFIKYQINFKILSILLESYCNIFQPSNLSPLSHLSILLESYCNEKEALRSIHHLFFQFSWSLIATKAVEELRAGKTPTFNSPGVLLQHRPCNCEFLSFWRLSILLESYCNSLSGGFGFLRIVLSILLESYCNEDYAPPDPVPPYFQFSWSLIATITQGRSASA